MKQRIQDQTHLLDLSIISQTFNASMSESHEVIEVNLNVKYEPTTLGTSSGWPSKWFVSIEWRL